MYQKGFVNILVILIVVAILLFGTVMLFFDNISPKQVNINQNKTATQDQSNTSSESAKIPIKEIGEEKIAKRFNISGMAYIDENGNQIHEISEKPFADAQIQIIYPDGEKKYVRTDSNGYYAFSNLKPTVSFKNPERKYYNVGIINPLSEGKEYEWAGIVSNNFEVPPNQKQDFPVRARTNLQGYEITVFLDENGNGLLEPSEKGISEIELSIFSSGSGSTSKTNTDGQIKSADIYGGYVALIMKIPEGFISTSYEDRDGGYINAFIDINSGQRQINLGLKPGKGKNLEYDPNQTYEVSGWIFVDSNKNGVKDSNETGVTCSILCINTEAGKGFLLSLTDVELKSQNGGLATNKEGYFTKTTKGGVYHIAVPLTSLLGYKPTTSLDKTFTLNSNRVISFGVTPE